MSFASTLERVKKDKIVDPFLLKDYFRNPTDFYTLERFVAISGPQLFGIVHALAAFFLKKNESAAALRAFWEDVGRLEVTPPFLWASGPHPARRLGAGLDLGPFWWLRNPVGKMMVSSAVPYLWPVLRSYVYRSLELKIRYDLTRLLAHIRLENISVSSGETGPIHALLATAECDPYSGQPYRYNPDLAVIYSIGPDREDNGGREKVLSRGASDIAITIKFATGD
jgi:hypothetical protein